MTNNYDLCFTPELKDAFPGGSALGVCMKIIMIDGNHK